MAARRNDQSGFRASGEHREERGVDTQRNHTLTGTSQPKRRLEAQHLPSRIRKNDIGSAQQESPDQALDTGPIAGLQECDVDNDEPLSGQMQAAQQKKKESDVLLSRDHHRLVAGELADVAVGHPQARPSGQEATQGPRAADEVRPGLCLG